MGFELAVIIPFLEEVGKKHKQKQKLFSRYGDFPP